MAKTTELKSGAKKLQKKGGLNSSKIFANTLFVLGLVAVLVFLFQSVKI